MTELYQARYCGGRFLKNRNGRSQKRRGRSQKEGILTALGEFDRLGDRLLPKSLDSIGCVQSKALRVL